MKQRKITFIAGTLNRGGAERVISIIANYYAKKNWNVDIILLLDKSCEFELDSRITLIPIIDKKKSSFKQLPTWLYELRKYIKYERPDVILSFIARINIITAIASLGLNKNLIVSERNDPSKDGRSVFIKWATHFIYPKVSKVIFQTREAQSYFKANTIKNSTIIYNPVEVKTNYKNSNSKEIISVGRLQPQKNHKLLILAFKDVLKKHPEYKLKIYGEGPIRNELEALILENNLENSIFLPGKIRNIHEKMSQAEIFVLSSNFEGLSNALLEAMSIGMPIVSTDCAGSNEIIKPNRNGLLVPIKNQQKMSEAILSLIENKNYGLQLGTEAKKTSKLFSSHSILKQWEETLENGIAESDGR